MSGYPKYPEQSIAELIATAPCDAEWRTLMRIALADERNQHRLQIDRLNAMLAGADERLLRYASAEDTLNDNAALVEILKIRGVIVPPARRDGEPVRLVSRDRVQEYMDRMSEDEPDDLLG